MASRSNSRRRLSIAYHEAAHAVLCWYYGFEMKQISIRPTRNSCGRVVIGNAFHGLMPDVWNDRQLVPQVEHFAMMTLSGPITTRLVDSSIYAKSDGDDERKVAHDWLSSVFGAMTESVARWSELEARTHRLLLRKDIWARVTALAYVLLEREVMPSTDAVRVIESVPGVPMRTDRGANERLRKLADTVPDRLKRR